MFSTIGNSTVPASGSSLISVAVGTITTLPFYSTGGGSTTITNITGVFGQLVLLNQGTATAYASVDGGVTWCALPPNAQPLVFRTEAMVGSQTVQVAAPSGGSTVTGISAWANPSGTGK